MCLQTQTMPVIYNVATPTQPPARRPRKPDPRAALSPRDISPAAVKLAAELHLGTCWFCRRPLFPNFVSFPVVHGEDDTDGFFSARAHRTCYDQQVETPL